MFNLHQYNNWEIKQINVPLILSNLPINNNVKRDSRGKQSKKCGRTYIKSFQSLSFYPIWLINLLRIFLLIMVILVLIPSIQRQIFSTSVYTLILSRVIAWIAMCRRLKKILKNMSVKNHHRNKVCSSKLFHKH